MKEQATHESLEANHEAAQSSPRAFGFMLAVVLALFALWPLLDRQPPHAWPVLAALAMAALAWRFPQIFAIPNRGWLALGALGARIVAPVALALLFAGMFVPIGWLMRRFGHDPLRLRRDAGAPSYWIERDPPGPAPDSLNHPF